MIVYVKTGDTRGADGSLFEWGDMPESVEKVIHRGRGPPGSI